MINPDSDTKADVNNATDAEPKEEAAKPFKRPRGRPFSLTPEERYQKELAKNRRYSQRAFEERNMRRVSLWIPVFYVQEMRGIARDMRDEYRSKLLHKQYVPPREIKRLITKEGVAEAVARFKYKEDEIRNTRRYKSHINLDVAISEAHKKLALAYETEMCLLQHELNEARAELKRIKSRKRKGGKVCNSQ